MVESWFSPQKSESMRPFTQKAADELVDAMLCKQRPVDLMEAFATPLPFKVSRWTWSVHLNHHLCLYVLFNRILEKVKNLMTTACAGSTFKSVQVIYAMLGIPFEDYHFLSTNVAVRASASGTARDASTAAQDLMDYMNKLVREARGMVHKNCALACISCALKQIPDVMGYLPT